MLTFDDAPGGRSHPSPRGLDPYREGPDAQGIRCLVAARMIGHGAIVHDRGDPRHHRIVGIPSDQHGNPTVHEIDVDGKRYRLCSFDTHILVPAEVSSQ